jgi:hypothetical protein
MLIARLVAQKLFPSPASELVTIIKLPQPTLPLAWLKAFLIKERLIIRNSSAICDLSPSGVTMPAWRNFARLILLCFETLPTGDNVGLALAPLSSLLLSAFGGMSFVLCGNLSAEGGSSTLSAWSNLLAAFSIMLGLFSNGDSGKVLSMSAFPVLSTWPSLLAAFSMILTPPPDDVHFPAGWSGSLHDHKQCRCKAYRVFASTAAYKPNKNRKEMAKA